MIGLSVRFEVWRAVPVGRPLDGVRDRAAPHSEEPGKDRRGYAEFEDRKPRRGRMDEKANHEAGDASDHRATDRTNRRPSRNQRQRTQTRHLAMVRRLPKNSLIVDRAIWRDV